MTEAELHSYIVLNYPKEHEACEWKGFRRLRNSISGRSGEDVISYVSALANMEGGTLVIGVEDETLNILGISDVANFTPENLPLRLIGNCTNLQSEGLKVEEYVTSDTDKRVWIIHVPKHAPRSPVYAHRKAWQRSGDSLIEMRPERRNAILQESIREYGDWSREICCGASIKDLSPSAIKMAKQNYAVKFPHLEDDMSRWDVETFLNKARILIDGMVTRTAIILLGKEESTHFLEGAIAQLTWILKDKDNLELDYLHLGPPLLLNVDRLFGKIRNLKYRYIRDASLFPEEVDMYDPFVVREALHNCIAHQDYTLPGPVLLVEFPDRLLFINNGAFIPGSVENAIERDAPDTESRNPFLTRAMFNLNMIDTIGSGIKRMFLTQRKRYFPLPSYDFDAQKVKVEVHGKVLDLQYARLLAQTEDISLTEIIILDKVQKNKFITDEEAKALRERGYLEGRKPNYYVSSTVANVTERRAAYIRNRAFDDEHYQKMIIKYIREFGSASRADVDLLLRDKLSDLLSEKQKKSKVGNLLSKLRANNLIHNEGSRTKPRWVLRD